MANVRNSNTFYIDTAYSVSADELAVRNIRLTSVIITATGANGRVVLSDSNLATKLDLRALTSGTSVQLLLADSPIVFSTSIRPTTLSNAVVTCVIDESRG